MNPCGEHLVPAKPRALELEVVPTSPITDWVEGMLGRGPKLIILGGRRYGKTQALREALAKNVTPRPARPLGALPPIA